MTDEPVRLPGERAQRTIAENLELGIAVAPALIARLRDLAGDLGVQVTL
jgi:LDH2 family malate/lactate/ureidoglycolate dehydrogenase